MEIVDIGKHGKYRLASRITKIAGGRFDRKTRWTGSGVGIGGLRYEGGAQMEVPQHKLMANMEMLRDGLVVYLRNESVNYAVIYNYRDIQYVEFSKQADVLCVTEQSYFAISQRWGLPFYLSRLLLLDDEVVEQHDPFMTIHTLDTSLNLRAVRKNYRTIELFLQKIPKVDIRIDLKDFVNNR